MSKYEVERNPRVQFKEDTGWYLTDHAADRWDQRTPPHSVSPEKAFKFAIERGSKVRYLTDSLYKCDELWYFRDDSDVGGEYGALFLCKHERISTVITDDMMPYAALGLCRSVWNVTGEGGKPYEERGPST